MTRKPYSRVRPRCPAGRASAHDVQSAQAVRATVPCGPPVLPAPPPRRHPVLPARVGPATAPPVIRLAPTRQPRRHPVLPARVGPPGPGALQSSGPRRPASLASPRLPPVLPARTNASSGGIRSSQPAWARQAPATPSHPARAGPPAGPAPGCIQVLPARTNASPGVRSSQPAGPPTPGDPQSSGPRRPASLASPLGSLNLPRRRERYAKAGQGRRGDLGTRSRDAGDPQPGIFPAAPQPPRRRSGGSPAWSGLVFRPGIGGLKKA